MNRYLPIDVRCPRCGSPPGEKCRRIAVRNGAAVDTGGRRRSHLGRFARAASESARRTPRTP